MNTSRFLIAVATLCCTAATGGATTAEVEPIPRDHETGMFRYQETVTVEGVSSNGLYSRASAWVAMAYKSANNVIQLDEPGARLIARGTTDLSWLLNRVYIDHVVTIEVKDGRYRYTVDRFVVEYSSEHRSAEPLDHPDSLRPGRKKMLRKIAAEIESLIDSLKAAMREPSTVGSDEW